MQSTLMKTISPTNPVGAWAAAKAPMMSKGGGAKGEESVRVYLLQSVKLLPFTQKVLSVGTEGNVDGPLLIEHSKTVEDKTGLSVEDAVFNVQGCTAQVVLSNYSGFTVRAHEGEELGRATEVVIVEGEAAGPRALTEKDAEWRIDQGELMVDCSEVCTCQVLADICPSPEESERWQTRLVSLH